MFRRLAYRYVMKDVLKIRLEHDNQHTFKLQRYQRSFAIIKGSIIFQGT